MDHLSAAEPLNPKYDNAQLALKFSNPPNKKVEKLTKQNSETKIKLPRKKLSLPSLKQKPI